MNTSSPVLREIYDRIKHEPHSAIELVPSGILLSRWHGEVLSPSVHVHFTHEEFSTFRDSLSQSDIDELWPGTSADETAIRLLLVHLAESLDTRCATDIEMTLGPHGLGFW